MNRRCNIVIMLVADAIYGRNVLVLQVWCLLIGFLYSVELMCIDPSLGKYSAFLVFILTIISIFDFRYKLIPFFQVMALAGTGVLALAQINLQDALQRIIGAGFAVAVLALSMKIYARVKGQDGLGWGDVKLVGAGALWVDPMYLGPWFLLATLSAFASLAFMRWQGAKITRQTSIPFGPHLACGLWIVWLAQNSQF